jgi:hypothetical protein
VSSLSSREPLAVRATKDERAVVDTQQKVADMTLRSGPGTARAMHPGRSRAEQRRSLAQVSVGTVADVRTALESVLTCEGTDQTHASAIGQETSGGSTSA